MAAKSHIDVHPVEHNGIEWIYSDTGEIIDMEDHRCKCQGCGNSYKLDLIVPDDLWEKIKPKGKPKGAGLLCGSCIMKKVEKIFQYSVFGLKER